MSEFTKGPWFCEEIMGSFDISSDDQDVALVFGFDPDNTGFNILGECQANANLIAAAPDMYEVLEDIYKNHDAGFYVDTMIRKVLEKARGDILKELGE